MGEIVKQAIRELGTEIAAEFWETLIGSIKTLSYSVALVGAGIFIILHVVGYEKGSRYASILVTLWALITFLTS